jgi:hypothetical protein
MKKRILIVTALVAGSFLGFGIPASQGATTTPTPKPSIAGGAGGQSDANRGGVAFKAYRDCLTKQGVTLPTRGLPGAAPTASATPNAKTQKAVAACASLLPKGGFGGSGFRAGGTAFVAFTSCMKDHGITIPVPGAALKAPAKAPLAANPKTSTSPKATVVRPTLAPSAGGAERGRGGILAGLNQKDPKVAAAVKICGVLLPKQN